MSDLESQLRAEFGETPGVDRDSVPDLLATTQRLRRRRTVMTGATAFAAVVVAAAVTVFAIGLPGARKAPPAIPPHPAPSAAVEQLFGKIGLPMSGGFTRPDHGVFLVMRCTGMAEGTVDDFKCGLDLATTEDGGASFARRDVPMRSLQGIDAFAVTLFVFDDDRLILDKPAMVDFSSVPDKPTLPSDYPTKVPDNPPTRPAERWMSEDGGQNWLSVSPADGPAVSQIPIDGQLMGPVSTALGIAPSPIRVLTADGTSHQLSTAPRNATSVGDPVIGARNEIDGWYFLSTVADRAGQRQGLAISRDRGRTWQNLDLPTNHGYTVLGSDRNHLYFYSSGAVPEDRTITDEAFMMSTDGGRTFSSVPIPPPPKATDPSASASPVEVGGKPVSTTDPGTSIAVSPDGNVLLSDGLNLWRLNGKVQKFERVESNRVTYLVISHPGAVFAGHNDGSEQVVLEMSQDGQNWKACKFS